MNSRLIIALASCSLLASWDAKAQLTNSPAERVFLLPWQFVRELFLHLVRVHLFAWDWLRAGMVAQRTKAYKSDLDIQRGFLVGVTYKRVDFTTHVFSLGWTDPVVVLAMGFAF
jgi:hypothetical protein